MNRLDYGTIRKQISITEVLHLIGYEPHQTRGDQWRGPCPICDRAPHDNKRCFSTNIRKNIFRCFHCDRSGNALDLWTHLSGLPLYQATLELCEKLNIQPATLENPQPRNRR